MRSLSLHHINHSWDTIPFTSQQDTIIYADGIVKGQYSVHILPTHKNNNTNTSDDDYRGARSVTNTTGGTQRNGGTGNDGDHHGNSLDSTNLVVNNAKISYIRPRVNPPIVLAGINHTRLRHEVSFIERKVNIYAPLAKRVWEKNQKMAQNNQNSYQNVQNYSKPPQLASTSSSRSSSYNSSPTPSLFGVLSDNQQVSNYYLQTALHHQNNPHNTSFNPNVPPNTLLPSQTAMPIADIKAKNLPPVDSRLEWLLLTNDKYVHPYSTTHFDVRWIVSSGPTASEYLKFVFNIGTRLGLDIVQIPSEQTVVETRDSFNEPITLPLQSNAQREAIINFLLNSKHFCIDHFPYHHKESQPSALNINTRPGKHYSQLGNNNNNNNNNNNPEHSPPHDNPHPYSSQSSSSSPQPSYMTTQTYPLSKTTQNTSRFEEISKNSPQNAQNSQNLPQNITLSDFQHTSRPFFQLKPKTNQPTHYIDKESLYTARITEKYSKLFIPRKYQHQNCVRLEKETALFGQISAQKVKSGENISDFDVDNDISTINGVQRDASGNLKGLVDGDGIGRGIEGDGDLNNQQNNSKKEKINKKIEKDNFNIVTNDQQHVCCTECTLSPSMNNYIANIFTCHEQYVKNVEFLCKNFTQKYQQLMTNSLNILNSLNSLNNLQDNFSDQNLILDQNILSQNLSKSNIQDETRFTSPSQPIPIQIGAQSDYTNPNPSFDIGSQNAPLIHKKHSLTSAASALQLTTTNHNPPLNQSPSFASHQSLSSLNTGPQVSKSIKPNTKLYPTTQKSPQTASTTLMATNTTIVNSTTLTAPPSQPFSTASLSSHPLINTSAVSLHSNDLQTNISVPTTVTTGSALPYQFGGSAEQGLQPNISEILPETVDFAALFLPTSYHEQEHLLSQQSAANNDFDRDNGVENQFGTHLMSSGMNKSQFEENNGYFRVKFRKDTPDNSLNGSGSGLSNSGTGFVNATPQSNQQSDLGANKNGQKNHIFTFLHVLGHCTVHIHEDQLIFHPHYIYDSLSTKKEIKEFEMDEINPIFGQNNEDFGDISTKLLQNDHNSNLRHHFSMNIGGSDEIGDDGSKSGLKSNKNANKNVKNSAVSNRTNKSAQNASNAQSIQNNEFLNPKIQIDRLYREASSRLRSRDNLTQLLVLFRMIHSLWKQFQ
jgi:hypothetical protein